MKYPDDIFMRTALQLAERGRGRTQTNPLVGAVVVKNGRTISCGYHASFGTPHAEVAALKKAGKRARGATLYVTLEPCSTYGKTPPCTELIIKSGVRRVVVGMYDPNPLHYRRGVRILKKRGIPVTVGILREEIKKQNEAFMHSITNERPFVIVKLAQSLDGKIATRTGHSRWITGERARRYVHELRSQVDAIMVGKGTVLADDPHLTVRHRQIQKQPVRIVVDSQGKLPLSKKIFHRAKKERVIIVTSKNISSRKKREYGSAGVRHIEVPLKNRKIDLKRAMKKLYSCDVGTILVEGGGSLVGSLFDTHLVDKVFLFQAPMVIGGREAKSSIGGNGVSRVHAAIPFQDISCKTIGADFLFMAYPQYNLYKRKK